jgi:Ca2+-binding RTX toxin-like protein
MTLTISTSATAYPGVVPSRGGPGTDFIDWIYGTSGDDIIAGYGGNDRLYGGAGSDRLNGGSGNDTLDGGTGADWLFGGSGNDTVYGGDGIDFIDGGTGDDLLDGGIGDDLFIGGQGADRMLGGDGFDTLTYGYSSLGVIIDFKRGEGLSNDARGDTFASIEEVIGTGQGDVILGSDAGMTMDGGQGADWLTGGMGNDVLIGGIGDDTLRGNGGADQFVISFDPADDSKPVAQAGVDVIVDFEAGKDKIVIQGMTALDAFGSDGVLARGFIATDGSFHGRDPGDVLWFDAVHDVLYEIHPELVNGEVATLNAKAIAHFGSDVSLQTSDFAFL